MAKKKAARRKRASRNPAGLTDIKNCPFCKSTKVVVRAYPWGDCVECDGCNCQGPPAIKDKEMVIELWNQRHA